MEDASKPVKVQNPRHGNFNVQGRQTQIKARKNLNATIWYDIVDHLNPKGPLKLRFYPIGSGACYECEGFLCKFTTFRDYKPIRTPDAIDFQYLEAVGCKDKRTKWDVAFLKPGEAIPDASAPPPVDTRSELDKARERAKIAQDKIRKLYNK